LKHFRSSLILLGCLILIGLYVFFVEYRSKGKAEQKELFFSKDISELVITNNGSKTKTHLLNKNSEWIVNGKDHGDAKKINTTIQSLKEKPERTVSPSPTRTELHEYGLDNPVMTIDITGNGPNERETIYIGAKTPVGFGRYLWLKSKNTIVISSEIYDSFNTEVK
jgi:hypothetical protein